MSADSNKQGEVLSSLEIDTIGEIMNISMGSAATAASTLLDNKVTITTPVVKVIPTKDFDIAQLEPAIAVEIQYVEGISGSNLLILRKSDMRTILTQMMNTEIPEDYVIDDMSESAICELMNQMMGSSATVLSCFLGRTINISTPLTIPIGELEEFKSRYFGDDPSMISIEFKLTIQDSIESVFLCVMKIDLAKEIIGVSLNFDDAVIDEELMATPPAPPQEQAPPPQPQQAPPPQQAAPGIPPQPMAQGQQPAPGYEQLPYTPQYTNAPPQYAQPQYAPPPQGYGYPPPYTPQQPYAPAAGYEQQPVAVKDYNYGDFGENGVGEDGHPLNLDLVMNVPVTMTVELGRTRRKIKEILEFGQGTIVELDKQAGSQVDVIVNGQMIARGDVVVVDDNFSIRITEIIKNKDPMSML